MFKWHPIETAPKDGRRIIVCEWLEGDEYDIEPTIVFWQGNDWLVRWNHSSYTKGGSQPPTHWMPLPEPPQ